MPETFFSSSAASYRVVHYPVCFLVSFLLTKRYRLEMSKFSIIVCSVTELLTFNRRSGRENLVARSP